MKLERTTDRQVARLPHYQELIYEFPVNEFEWETNEQLDNLFLTAMGDGFAPIATRVTLQRLLQISPIDREKYYIASLEHLKAEKLNNQEHES